MDSGEFPLPSKSETDLPQTILLKKNFNEISDDDVKGIQHFVKKERDQAYNFAIGKDPKSKEVESMNEAQLYHHMYGFVPLVHREGKDGYLIEAREQDDIQGFGIINIDNSKEDPHRVSLYFGRAWEAGHKGIATKILQKQIETLKSIGIKSYIANVWSDSEEVYKRLGIKTEEIERNYASAKLLVRLD